MPRHLLPSRARPTAPWAARRADDEYGRSAQPDWRTVEWSRHLRRVEIAGSAVNYVDIGEGDGPPVVLVHGLAGQWQNWLENIPRLAQERRVVVPDLPGFGMSEMPQQRITVPAYGRFVEALCERLDLGRVALVGNSLGGFIASDVTIQQPQRVERLTLVSAAGITSANVYRAPALTLARVAAVMTTAAAARLRAMASRRRTRHLALVLVARHPGRLAGDVAWEGLMKGAGKPGFFDAMRASIEYDFRDRLSEISCPTLIVWGEDDTVLPLKDSLEYERLIPNSRRMVMKDTGHVPMLERPEAFNQLLLDFLAEPVAEAAPDAVAAEHGEAA